MTTDSNEQKRESAGSSAISIDDQIRCQTLRDPKRLSLGIDCHPGPPRPPEVFRSVIKGLALVVEDFEDPGCILFGCQEYLVKPNAESIARHLEAREVLGEWLTRIHARGTSEECFGRCTAGAGCAKCRTRRSSGRGITLFEFSLRLPAADLGSPGRVARFILQCFNNTYTSI